ncbi:MAG TPA: hypothetical protein PKN80_04845 [bacterium]|uniref:Uncharacterized protein n=1 Tax=candidate division TA06 bacterium ADurb.Bin417 TaxID=1852828 RepID=A0A1V5MBC3_UNCT6|nr:MAG: hypothetical protein BWY73_01309 [candidate division TA06 bacterium ADurb.Bin417]HNQ35376.1 hypothetical protein [bacterium]HNS48353.1 hypothetical protein [bacterium]
MFIALLIVNFLVALLVCTVIVRVFGDSIDRILRRLVQEDIYNAWVRYITFTIYVVGVSGGVRIWMLEKYISPQAAGGTMLELNWDRWTLELYRTVIDTMQSVAWMLLLFFLFALIAYVIVKGLEGRRAAKP